MMQKDLSFKPLVAVCGAGACDRATTELARELGHRLAEWGAVLICGGLGGVMEAAAKGAQQAGGLTIGLLPGIDPRDANPHIDLVLPTGLGHLRNALITRAAEVVVALPGGPGTLSEIALGLKMGKPVIALGAWSHIDGIETARTPEEAASMARDRINTATRR